MMSQCSLSRSCAASTLAYHSLPGRAAQLLGRAAMAGELAAVDRVAGAREAVGDEPQLGRRAAEAVDQQHAEAAAGDEVAAIRHVLIRHLFFLFRYFSMHAGVSRKPSARPTRH